MLEQLDMLETKLAQVLESYQATRQDNARLRQQMVVLENTNKLLTERLSEARSRMEVLFNKLPD
jgi:hypothetical protein